jgi:hypothetical protein
MALGAFLLFLPYCVSEEGGAVVADARDPTSAFPSGDDGEWVDCGSVLFSPLGRHRGGYLRDERRL